MSLSGGTTVPRHYNSGQSPLLCTMYRWCALTNNSFGCSSWTGELFEQGADRIQG